MSFAVTDTTLTFAQPTRWASLPLGGWLSSSTPGYAAAVAAVLLTMMSACTSPEDAQNLDVRQLGQMCISTDKLPNPFGLSRASLAMTESYGRAGLLPDGAVEWADLAVTPADAKRLNAISRYLDEDRGRAEAVARSVVGKETFVGLTWSYVDGFVISTTEDPSDELVDQVREELGKGVPFTFVRGLVPETVRLANMEALSKVGIEHGGPALHRGSDERCGLVFVGYMKAKDEGTIDFDEILEPGTYVIDNSSRPGIGRGGR